MNGGEIMDIPIYDSLYEIRNDVPVLIEGRIRANIRADSDGNILSAEIGNNSIFQTTGVVVVIDQYVSEQLGKCKLLCVNNSPQLVLKDGETLD